MRIVGKGTFSYSVTFTVRLSGVGKATSAVFGSGISLAPGRGRGELLGACGGDSLVVG